MNPELLILFNSSLQDYVYIHDYIEKEGRKRAKGKRILNTEKERSNCSARSKECLKWLESQRGQSLQKGEEEK